MAKIKLRVTAEDVVSVETENYRDQYVEKCEEDGETPKTDVPEAFVLAAYTAELESGELDLDEALENAAISVESVVS